MKKKLPKNSKLLSYNIIFCEDEKSSKMYLELLRQIYGKTNFRIEKCKTGGGYVNMINSSIKEIKRIETNENVKFTNKYIVVDLDKSCEDKTQKKKLEEFKKIAKDNNIKVIYCDPNFEIYLLLHFECCCLENKDIINRKLIGYINKEFSKNITKIDDIKKDLSIFRKICNDKNIINYAIQNNKNIFKNNNNRTNFYQLIETIIN